jgi:hypothetical protein
VDIRDPERRKTRLEKTRLDLQVRILDVLEQIDLLNHEIEQCDIDLNEQREIAALS